MQGLDLNTVTAGLKLNATLPDCKMQPGRDSLCDMNGRNGWPAWLTVRAPAAWKHQSVRCIQNMFFPPHLACEAYAHHDHASHPEEQDVMACLQDLQRTQIYNLLNLSHTVTTS